MAEPAVSIFSDVACELGEGPSYDPGSAKLFWFDIVGRKLMEKVFPDGETVAHDLPFMASAMAVVDAGRQLIVAENGLHIRDMRTGALTLHTPLEADNPLTRSNDSRVHPSGSMWIGTMPKDEGSKDGAIYWFHAGEIRLIYPGIAIPNSICFSPDGATAYFIDTPTGLLLRVACDPLTGLPQGEPAVFLDWRGQEGHIDGSVVDADGVLWNARWGAGSLDAWSPEGRRLRSIPIPARQSSCPAFVGPDAARIAVTSAWKGMDAEARRADPHGGKTFFVDLPVRGRFEPKVLI
jgi:sugar lactone lactonase YvrE